MSPPDVILTAGPAVRKGVSRLEQESPLAEELGFDPPARYAGGEGDTRKPGINGALMAERTTEQILAQAVYAVACVARHYGPGFSEEGLMVVRRLLAQLPWFIDATYRVDFKEESPFVDFQARIVWPEDWDKLDFDEVRQESLETPEPGACEHEIDPDSIEAGGSSGGAIVNAQCLKCYHRVSASVGSESFY